MSAVEHNKDVQNKRVFLETWLKDAAFSVIEKMPAASVNKAFKEFALKDYHSNAPDALVRFVQVVSNVYQLPEGSKSYPPVGDYDKLISTGEAKDILGVSINTVKSWIEKSKLVGLKYPDKREFKLPMWQFEGNEVVDGIERVLHELDENGVPAERKFTTPLERFDDKCIIDVLREGDVKRAVEMAKVLKA